MIRLTYLTPWEVYWECPDPSELRWLKRQFEFKNTSDLWHKKQFGYFPMVSFLDDIQFRMTHGQALWLRELVKGTNIQLAFVNWVPRFSVDTGPIPEDFLPGVKMRDYQRLATQIIAAQGHGLVCIDTGGGKTLVMGALLRIILDNTPCSGVLVLINSKDLLNQTADRFASYGVPMDEIGIIHSDISPAKQAKEAEKRVVLSTHMSITKFPGTITKTQYVLCDEAHEAIGPLWSQLLSRLPNMLNAIGFTATPWEDQDEEHRMRAIFGTKLVDIPARFLIQQGYLMKPEVIVIRLEYKDRDKKLVEKMNWQDAKKFFVEEDRARNLLPVVCLKKIGGRMLVLFDTISHGKLVKDLYDKNAELHGFESRLADGGSSTKKRKQAIEWFEQDCSENELGKVLLGSRIFDQGTDINGGCDSLFLLGAAKSYRKTKQRVGRGLRKNRTGKLYLLDVDDINHKTLNAWSKNRQKVFEELGVPIRRVTLQEFIAMEM